MTQGDVNTPSNLALKIAPKYCALAYIAPRKALRKLAVTLDGLWTVQFTSANGASGAGIVVLSGSSVLGGDSNYYYRGESETVGEQFRANMSITHYFGGLNSIFGGLRSFSLAMQGSTSDRLIIGTGFDPRMPGNRLTIRLQRITPLAGAAN